LGRKKSISDKRKEKKGERGARRAFSKEQRKDKYNNTMIDHDVATRQRWKKKNKQ
jgi:hypothetical protein